MVVAESHPSGILDHLCSLLIIVFALPLVYLTFSMPIYFRASYSSLQGRLLLSHFVLSNVLGYFALGIVAVFSSGESATVQNIKEGKIVLDKFNS